jgi:hypothetical protein
VITMRAPGITWTRLPIFVGACRSSSSITESATWSSVSWSVRLVLGRLLSGQDVLADGHDPMRSRTTHRRRAAGEIVRLVRRAAASPNPSDSRFSVRPSRHRAPARRTLGRAWRRA